MAKRSKGAKKPKAAKRKKKGSGVKVGAFEPGVFVTDRVSPETGGRKDHVFSRGAGVSGENSLHPEQAD